LNERSTPASAASPAGPSARGPLGWLVATSAILFAVRLYAADHVGFGDSEALYACYALHPQPAYLDHPGLVGLLARAIGGGNAPLPAATHHLTAVLATLVPWVVALAARLAGATWRRATVAALCTAAAPEISFGLFALTPDLPLAFAWLGALGLAAAGLRAPPASNRAAAALLFAGTLAGVACAAKASGCLLLVALAVAYASPPARAHARTVWPWTGLLAGMLVIFPIASYEAHAGWPMLAHRLVDTQEGSRFSLRNVGALVGGQFLYLSPVILVLAGVVGRTLLRSLRQPPRDPVERLLAASFLFPLVILGALCLWSRVAEPHWIAPALLALPLYGAIAPRAPSPRLVVTGIVTGFLCVALAHAWVLVPEAARLRPESADASLDIANELFGWPRVLTAVEEIVDTARAEDPDDVPVVVGPFYTICAQLHAGLDRDIAVGCQEAIRDDFDDWLPRTLWENAAQILFVTDNRFPVDLAARFPDRFPARSWDIPIARGGRLVRTFRATLLLPRALGDARDPG
jgi:hypothetical protein